MAATSPEARARKARAREARRAARFVLDPAYREREREKRRASSRRRQAARTAKARAIRDELPFVGCDGEGMTDASGGHRYTLFRMGSRELYAAGKRLITPEILQFIVDHPSPDDLLVGFALEYDFSNILRDVQRVRDRPGKPSRLERLLAVDSAYKAGAANPYGGPTWTWLRFPGWPEFGVSYLPRNYLKVCLAETVELTSPTGETIVRTHARKGSTRTIVDVFGLFQSSFLKALQLWSIGEEHWQAIADMKAARSSFDAMSPEVRAYCATECELLAELMTAFRKVSLAAGIRPRSWAGAGKLAQALLDLHQTTTAATVEARTRAPMLRMAHAAYYGGRFEITRLGEICEPVDAHDINSAYPAAMRELPCLEHGVFVPATADELAGLGDDSLYVAPVKFSHPRSQFLCGFPFRSHAGLCWPREGNGVYWSPEIRSAQRLGATVELRDGWRYERRCDCQPFAWVEALYEERRRIGKAAKGIPIKLAINSLYGKMAQRIGRPKYSNPIWAGLITAITRARLNDAIAACLDPRDVVMIATDAVYTVGGPIEELDQGEGLGQWEHKRHDALFVVKPGLYWPPRPRGKAAAKWKLKTRGLSPKFFEPIVPLFEATWRAYCPRALDLEARIPSVPVEVDAFIGLRLAYRLGRPELACQWRRETKEHSFAWFDKRERFSIGGDGKHLVLESKAGGPAAQSIRYLPGVNEAGILLDEERMLFEAMPDYVDLSPPFSD